MAPQMEQAKLEHCARLRLMSGFKRSLALREQVDDFKAVQPRAPGLSFHWAGNFRDITLTSVSALFSFPASAAGEYDQQRLNAPLGDMMG